MKIFIDANVLITVLNREYPLFPYAARVLSLAGKKGFQLTTTSTCLAITFYFAEKKHGSVNAKNKIALLLEHLEIADCGVVEARLAVKDKKVLDFEDGLQFYAAKNHKCISIITHDLEDFHFSTIETLSPEDFLKKYYSKM